MVALSEKTDVRGAKNGGLRVGRSTRRDPSFTACRPKGDNKAAAGKGAPNPLYSYTLVISIAIFRHLGS
jgi:hypothetical protein